MLTIYLIELVAKENTEIEKVKHLQQEKKKFETMRSELSLECGKIETALQHQQELVTVYIIIIWYSTNFTSKITTYLES